MTISSTFSIKKGCNGTVVNLALQSSCHPQDTPPFIGIRLIHLLIVKEKLVKNPFQTKCLLTNKSFIWNIKVVNYYECFP